MFDQYSFPNQNTVFPVQSICVSQLNGIELILWINDSNIKDVKFIEQGTILLCFFPVRYTASSGETAGEMKLRVDSIYDGER